MFPTVAMHTAIKQYTIHSENSEVFRLTSTSSSSVSTSVWSDTS